MGSLASVGERPQSFFYIVVADYLVIEQSMIMPFEM